MGSSSMFSDRLMFGDGLAQGCRNGGIRSLPNVLLSSRLNIHLSHEGDENVHVFSLNQKGVMLGFGGPG